MSSDQHIDDVQVREAIAEIYLPEVCDDWMTTPQDSFDGLSPIEMIKSGRSDEVLVEIRRLAAGAF